MTAPVVYVTGVTRGVGRATALLLAQRGATVAGCYLERDDCAATLRRELAGHGRCLVHKVDVRDGAAVRRAAAEVEAELGGIDVLVNNAGILRFGYLNFTSPETAADVLDTNLGGALWFARSMAPVIARRGGGAIVNVLSAVAVANPPRAPCAVYSASKAALAGLTRGLARELAPLHVRVNAVAPGFIDTDMLGAVPAPVMAGITRLIPLGRLGRPEEIARIILFLALDAPMYLTGAIICADGGYGAQELGG